jgi:Two component regulator propeller
MLPIRTHSSLLLLVAAGTASAQPPIGQWRDHFSYLNTVAVVEGNGTAYCATRNGVFSYDPGSGELARITKVNALHDVDVSALGWSAAQGALVVGYGNGNLDLVYGSTSVNLSDIERSSIIGDKRIYHILCEGDLAYLSCGFGIVVMDMVRKEVKDTWFIFPNAAQQRVNAITFFQDSIYAATESGLFSAWKQDPNLAAFTNWHQRMDVPQPNGFFSDVEAYTGRLFVNWTAPPPSVAETDTIYYWDGAWQRLNDAYGRNTYGMDVSPDGQRLVIGQAFEVRQYDASLNRIFQTYGTEGQSLVVNAVAGASSGGVWTATRTLGLARNDMDASMLVVAPNGPENSGALKLDVHNDLLMVATGAVAGNWANLFSVQGIHFFEEGRWRTINKEDDPLMIGVNQTGSAVIDHMAVVVDPDDKGHAYTGSWEEGVLEWRNGSVQTIWNATNSSLGTTGNPADGNVDVAGLDFDRDGNLWVSNANTQNVISVRKKDGTWKSFNPGTVLGGNELLSDITAMENGQKWLVRPRTSGIVVFTDGGTIDDTGDDQWKVLTTAENQGKLPTLDVFAIAEDQDGEVWVGTGKGIAVFYNPEAVFSDENFDCQQILIEQDGNVQILLETEVVSVVLVDGGNRKWLGTQSSGAFLVSPDGTEQILHFTKDNSPLPSNNITSIAIDGVTGEVYFATDQGIVSYRGDATEGAFEASCANVFPNPVRETYQGSVAITGLIADSDVRITDMAGNLVYRTVSNGGQAMWPTTDLSGQRVVSGVYLVLASDPSGTEHCNTKVMVVR